MRGRSSTLTAQAIKLTENFGFDLFIFVLDLTKKKRVVKTH